MTKTGALAAISERRKNRWYIYEHLLPAWQERTRDYLWRLDMRDKIMMREIMTGIRRYDVDE